MFFKKTRAKLRETIEVLKAAFALFVYSVEKLRQAVDANTSKVEALTAEQKVLSGKFDVLIEHSAFLARAKKNELSRQGHNVI